MALLSAIVKASERAGFWTLQGDVFPENTASLTLFAEARVSSGGHAEADLAAWMAGGSHQ